MRVATPLLLVLICVELSDVVFAVDSVPAVFGVTKVGLLTPTPCMAGHIISLFLIDPDPRPTPHLIALKQDPFVVYTSNIFAILGLRSLYTVLANAVVDLPYLKPGAY
jgi:predicted tellurium resistance membrane protein TerC